MGTFKNITPYAPFGSLKLAQEKICLETKLVENTLVENTIVEIPLALNSKEPLYFMYEGVDDAQWVEFPEIVSQIA